MHRSRTGSLVVASLLALAGPAGAQDDEAPPEDLLSHVKVGQRYTFAWTAGEHTHEELWHVARVHPDGVEYVLTTRMKQGGKVLVEHVDESLQTWTWGGRPVLGQAALALGKMSQARKKLDVPGAAFDCVVTTMDGGLESWVAVKGELETFPGTVKLGGKEGLVRSLVKCEDAGPPPALPERPPQEAVEADSGLPKGALDHVKVGQRWVFRVLNGDVTAETTWTVTEVHAPEGRVVYRVKTVVDAGGERLSTEDEEPSEWTAGGMPVLDPGTKVEGMRGERKVLDVGGVKLPCYAVTTELGDLRTETWTAVRGDHEVFPGPVKVVVGPTQQVLVRIEGP